MPDLNKASSKAVLFLMPVYRRAMFAIMLAGSGSLWGFGSKQLVWDTDKIELSVQSPELIDPLIEAMAFWNQIPCMRLHFVLNPASLNKVRLIIGSNWEFENDSLGMTVYSYDGKSRGILSANVFIHHAGRKWSFTDYKNVLVHELGHVLGLEHSDVSGSVMHPYGSLGSSEYRLSEDDIRGACSLAPVPPSKRGGQIVETRTGNAAGFNCTQSRPESMALLVAVLFLMLRLCACREKTETSKRVG